MQDTPRGRDPGRAIARSPTTSIRTGLREHSAWARHVARNSIEVRIDAIVASVSCSDHRETRARPHSAAYASIEGSGKIELSAEGGGDRCSAKAMPPRRRRPQCARVCASKTGSDVPPMRFG